LFSAGCSEPDDPFFSRKLDKFEFGTKLPPICF